MSGPALTTTGAAGSVDQILDVLIDNALRHGAGTVTLTPRAVYGGGAIDVADEGRSLNLADESRVFTRGEGQGTGIGLSLARSLAEAEQGRLILLHTQPTTFSLILLDPEPTNAQR